MLGAMRFVAGLLVCACTTDLPAPDDFDGAGEGEGSAGTVPCDASPEHLEGCVEQQRYIDDLTAFGQTRPSGSEHWQVVQDACFDRLTALGYESQRQDYETGVNVIGRKVGATLPDEVVVVAAHYDGYGNCPGADDNATGVAGALEVARVLALAEFDRTLVVACWDQEEAGLIGSRYWITDVLASGGHSSVYFNFEMIGYASSEPQSQEVPLGFDVLFAEAYAQVEANAFRGDFIAVITDDLARPSADALARHATRIGLPALVLEVPPELKNSPLLTDLRRSDHAPFWMTDQPAMMITDTANFRNEAYHCGKGMDTLDRLDHTFATGVIRATAAAAAEALGLR
jgi:hypothetical protein